MAESLMLGLYFQGNQQRFDMAAEKAAMMAPMFSFGPFGSS